MTETDAGPLAFVSVADLAGVWKREALYEPRDKVADTAARDGSVVLWAQTPQGAFVDVRFVRGEQFKVRGFAGRAVLSFPTLADPAADPTAFVCTWHRHTDTWPASCPSGVDSATCRVIGDLKDATAQPILMEEGDGYLEVWRRVLPWDKDVDRHFSHAAPGQNIEVSPLQSIQIHFANAKATFSSTATSVAVDGLGVKLNSAA